MQKYHQPKKQVDIENKITAALYSITTVLLSQYTMAVIVIREQEIYFLLFFLRWRSSLFSFFLVLPLCRTTLRNSAITTGFFGGASGSRYGGDVVAHTGLHSFTPASIVIKRKFQSEFSHACFDWVLITTRAAYVFQVPDELAPKLQEERSDVQNLLITERNAIYLAVASKVIRLWRLEAFHTTPKP